MLVYSELHLRTALLPESEYSDTDNKHECLVSITDLVKTLGVAITCITDHTEGQK